MCTARYGSAADPSGCCLLHSRSVRLCYNNRRFVSSWSREVSAFRRADRQAQHLAAADRDRDNHRNRHDAPLLQRRSGPVILQGAGEKRGDLVVDLGAHNHETWFSEMPIHRLRQTVDPSGSRRRAQGLLDNRRQYLLGQSPRLQKVRKVAARRASPTPGSRQPLRCAALARPRSGSQPPIPSALAAIPSSRAANRRPSSSPSKLRRLISCWLVARFLTPGSLRAFEGGAVEDFYSGSAPPICCFSHRSESLRLLILLNRLASCPAASPQFRAEPRFLGAAIQKQCRKFLQPV